MRLGVGWRHLREKEIQYVFVSEGGEHPFATPNEQVSSLLNYHLHASLHASTTSLCSSAALLGKSAMGSILR